MRADPKTLLLSSFALGLAALAVGSLVFQARLPGRLPTDDDYRAAHERIVREARPGDIAVIAPAWADRGRRFLVAVPSYAAYDPAGDVYPGTNRQWLVALADAPRFDLESVRETLAARAHGSGPGTRIGALWVEPFDIAGPAVIRSLTDAVEKGPSAGVSVAIEGTRREECPWIATPPGGRFQCPRGGWNAVTTGWYEVEERPLRCIWAHPVGEEPVRLRYAGVPAGGHVRGRGAFVKDAGNSPGGAPVTVTVAVDGRPAGHYVFLNQPGLQPFDLPLPVGEADAPVELSLDVTTPQAGVRHFCLDAWVGPAADP